ncbi:hypothetical protein FC52_GL001628 [Lactobacillus pasteurii DSM 23907 = CRBIP 24.76]|uniref:Uncharacterized protein n=1 Tax=Lactobacillus pasteurii DSM 23907 = CRBIP 24.76 TaxID=1423790 RepID=I7IYM8_9LACO|nr:hypothetical protein [Lactobacillus pasteurii]KRK07598.1 hypothetical protein FC52_GL001628 [Lactobacillus pasteurii DSM 23907 = CRBIP 24.76]TDG77115.1 hypothetical protein C5L33_000308 [Lactobacillus pasteurii]CCI84597.1 Protein of unknown function [Lactobacillus pasteurii DSM 23907 = CRBIP 24.76]
MQGIWKTKYRGFKRKWQKNFTYFMQQLNDPEETEFGVYYGLENGKRRISGKYKRQLIDFFLESQKYRAEKFPGELNYLFLQIDDILQSEIYTTKSREDFNDWLKNKTKKYSDWSIFEPIPYQEIPQVYKDFFSEEVAKKGFLFKCYFFDETIDDATYVYVRASDQALNDDIYKVFFSDSKIINN